MTPIHRDIFKAIHEGRWLSIEYRNKQDQVTRYWIGIRNLNVGKRSLTADGLHLGRYCLERLNCVYIDSILSAQIIEGSYCPVNKALVRDIHLNPHKYRPLFEHVANLKVLNYLEDCNRMDTTPYKADFSLVRFLDRESFDGGAYPLSEEQFRAIVKNFQKKAERDAGREAESQNSGRAGKGNGTRPAMNAGEWSGPPWAVNSGEYRGTPAGVNPGAGEKNRPAAAGTAGTKDWSRTIQRLAMNVLSIYTGKGLYVLAYRALFLDVARRCLRPDEDITICTEFTIDGVKESIRKFLDAEYYELLQDFEKNQEVIKDAILRSHRRGISVDDMPYILGLGMDVILDLHKEYGAVIEMYQKDEVSVPVKAFFGDLLDRPRSGRAVPIALLNRQVNLDQLLAIHNAMKYPVAYIQGPPGTGKTSTILNTIITAFFNEKTVLFSSYNNHPINGVAEKLAGMTYQGKRIPFPIVRLGNQEKVREALADMRALYEETKGVRIYGSTLDRNRADRAKRTKQLSALLKKYEDILDLKERGETISRLLEYNQKHGPASQMMSFELDLEGRQLDMVNRKIEKAGDISDEDALALLSDDAEDLMKYLYYSSAKYIKRLDEPKHSALKEILFMEKTEEQVEAMNHFLRSADNLKGFLQVFPVVATTCISAHRLGKPEIYFDMTIMDEASQCNTAVSLVPIIRGKHLMLVGDPQQLNPVILLDEVTNQKLRRKYAVADEYDYRKNSIYKTYLACDSVSDEVLLRYHYRCNQKIIDFNNRKYYNSKLLIKSNSRETQPLLYIDIPDGRADGRNTAPAEAEAIVRYARQNREKSIGVITPFVNQRRAIEERLREAGLDHVACGTVHAFQGDEKDVVLFSTAITDETYSGTYEWLKNNKELINVATSRAKDQLIILCSSRNLKRLHKKEEDDDLYDLIRYVSTNGTSEVAAKKAYSRALGVKPFSSETEEAFLQTLNHAMENIWLSQNRFSVEKEVAVSHVFGENVNYSDLFYSGRFDFVVYERGSTRKFPVLAIELDGKEHFESDVVMERDKKKKEICRAHEMELIRVENSYARRYQHVKGILEAYFKAMR